MLIPGATQQPATLAFLSRTSVPPCLRQVEVRVQRGVQPFEVRVQHGELDSFEMMQPHAAHSPAAAIRKCKCEYVRRCMHFSDFFSGFRRGHFWDFFAFSFLDLSGTFLFFLRPLLDFVWRGLWNPRAHEVRDSSHTWARYRDEALPLPCVCGVCVCVCVCVFILTNVPFTFSSSYGCSLNILFILMNVPFTFSSS